MPDDDNGTILDIGDRRTLRFVRRFSVDRSEVWSAITDSEQLGRWAYPGTIELRVGGTVHFDYGEQGEGHGTVLACDEPSLLEYEWGEGDERWRIRFELVDDGEGTVLTFDHFLPDPTQPQFAAGWHWHLDRLVDEVAGLQTPDVQSEARFVDLMEMYSAR